MNTAENLDIVLTDMQPETNKHAGLMVFWRLSGFIPRAALVSALSGIIPDKLMPYENTAEKALALAVRDARGAKSSKMVRRHKNGRGVSIVDEQAENLDLEREDRGDAYDVSYSAKLVEVDGHTVIRHQPAGHPNIEEVNKLYHLYKDSLQAGGDLSQWLTRHLMPHLGAVSGRDRGGFYLIPPHSVAKFRQVADALKSVSTYGVNNKLLNGVGVYCVPFIANDDMADAVFHNFLEECEDLKEQVESTEATSPRYGKRVWSTQRKAVQAMRDRLEGFASILGERMATFTESLEELNGYISIAEATLAFEVNNPEECSNSDFTMMDVCSSNVV